MTVCNPLAPSPRSSSPVCQKKKIQSWIFNRPPFERNIFSTLGPLWVIKTDRTAASNLNFASIAKQFKQRAGKYRLLDTSFEPTSIKRLGLTCKPGGWISDLDGSVWVYKDVSLLSSATDCLEKEELKSLETSSNKNESFSGLSWFAGNLPGTEASRMQ